MRELVIVISDLHLPSSGSGTLADADRGLVGLSQAARFGVAARLPSQWRPWLACWFGREDLQHAAPAAVAAVGVEDLRAAESEIPWIADPVHLVAGLRTVHLDYGGVLRLGVPTQAQLVRSFEAELAHTGFRMASLRSGRFLMMGPRASLPATVDPSRCLGSSIETTLPHGDGKAALQRLAGEIEMWLHAHPVNVARSRSRERSISTLWLWGGGAPLVLESELAGDQTSSHMMFGDDPYVDGLVRITGAASEALPSRFSEILGTKMPKAVLVVDAFRLPEHSPIQTPLQALEEIDRQWIAPAVAATGRGEIGRLAIVANDRCLTLKSRDRLKVWRRARGAFEGLR